MKTLVLLKPDAVERNLIGSIIFDLERMGFKIVRMTMVPGEMYAYMHYIEHKGKEFYEPLVESMEGNVVALVCTHINVPSNTVGIMRDYVGPYRDRTTGTLRFKYALDERRNSIHASDSVESAAREIDLWFGGLNDLPVLQG